MGTWVITAFPRPHNVERVATLVECAVAGITVTFRFPHRRTPVAMIRFLAETSRQLPVARRPHKHGRA